MKVKSKKDLPKWFNIDNYDSIRELNQPETLNQIHRRTKLIIGVSDAINNHAPPWVVDDLKNGSLWSTIIKGSPIVKGSPTIDLETSHVDIEWLEKIGIKATELNSLSIQNSLAIKGISASKVLNIGLQIEEFDLARSLNCDAPLKDFFKLYPSGFDQLDVNVLKPALRSAQDDSEVCVGINIANFSDEEILMQLTELLPIWREYTGFHNPKEKGLSKVSLYKKIHDYQVIACLDLYLWQILNRLKIPNKVLTVALFPNGEKGETELIQTVFPFVNKMINLVNR